MLPQKRGTTFMLDRPGWPSPLSHGAPVHPDLPSASKRRQSCWLGENRERFERELHRPRGYRFKRLPVSITRTSSLTKAVLATVCVRGLNLLVAAIILWNTVCLERAIGGFANKGGMSTKAYSSMWRL
jgi:hypothetical protein